MMCLSYCTVSRYTLLCLRLYSVWRALYSICRRLLYSTVALFPGGKPRFVSPPEMGCPLFRFRLFRFRLFRFRKWDARSFPFPAFPFPAFPFPEMGCPLFSVSGNGSRLFRFRLFRFRKWGARSLPGGGKPRFRKRRVSEWAQLGAGSVEVGHATLLPAWGGPPPPTSNTNHHTWGGHTSLSLLAEMIQNHKEGHAIFSTSCRVHITSTRYCTAQYHNGRSLIIHTYILHCLTESPPPLVYQPSCMHACPGRPGGGHARGSPQRSQTHLYYISPRCRHAAAGRHSPNPHTGHTSQP